MVSVGTQVIVYVTKLSSDLSRSRFRFNLSELLAVMALVSLSLVWPLILVFVVPLIGTKACKRMGYGSYAPVIATIGLSMALGVLFSFSYWHYPFEQPSTLAELCNIKAVEQLSWVSGLDSAGLSDPPAAIVNLPAGTLYWNNARELDAVDRIIAEFANRHVAIRSSTPIPIEVLTSIWTAADQAGLLISGEGGYPDTKSLHGYIGIAHKHNGSRFAFAALMGGQQSNDHYPYYEFVVPMDQEKLAVESSHWF